MQQFQTTKRTGRFCRSRAAPLGGKTYLRLLAAPCTTLVRVVQAVTAVFVMIASPSDVRDAREAVYTALARWNETNTSTRNVALVPLRWETGAVPMLGSDGQEIINRQLLRRADLVIALFGSRIGAPTADAISGTVAEIDHAERDGKAIHLYFSTAPHPNDIDPTQLQALREFRSEVEKRGLYGTFGSPEELTAHIWQAIDHDLTNVLDLTPSTRAVSSAGVDWLVQPGQESVPETDSRGRLKSRTKRWVDLTNRGDRDAEDVQIESLDPGIHVHSRESTVVHAGQTRRLPLLYSFGGSGDPVIRVRWTEGSEPQEREFHIG